ncbi:hypothetical protein MLD38_004879 [Melastoma candidum]|uniref:Uncharacterized protein n=1 Tax=Melastoma candidum TaxID=119954 RepID=A0ACB9S905_9MYRT|nr:hypothetical protein MLD38_004879 [Melastoma candidum]
MAPSMEEIKPKRVIWKQLDVEATNGVKIVRAQKELGAIIYSFIVPDCLSDEDGNWQAGAIATLIDSLGAGVNYLVTGILHTTVDLSISYLSTVRTQEEVEIEAKVLGPRGKLFLVMVEIRKKEDGKVVALANQWLDAVKASVTHLSKL